MTEWERCPDCPGERPVGGPCPHFCADTPPHDYASMEARFEAKSVPFTCEGCGRTGTADLHNLPDGHRLRMLNCLMCRGETKLYGTTVPQGQSARPSTGSVSGDIRSSRLPDPKPGVTQFRSASTIPPNTSPDVPPMPDPGCYRQEGFGDHAQSCVSRGGYACDCKPRRQDDLQERTPCAVCGDDDCTEFEHGSIERFAATQVADERARWKTLLADITPWIDNIPCVQTPKCEEDWLCMSCANRERIKLRIEGKEKT